MNSELEMVLALCIGSALGLIGGLAQLGERLVCNQEVAGSIPVFSTIDSHRLFMCEGSYCFKF